MRWLDGELGKEAHRDKYSLSEKRIKSENIKTIETPAGWRLGAGVQQI
jgi:hypothetical protein